MKKKKGIVQYLKDNNIDIDDSNIIRWVYIGEVKTNYMVTTSGDVISIRSKSSKKLKPFIDKDGYYNVMIYIKGKPHIGRVNRLVARAFIPNDDPDRKVQVNHKDGNKINNSVSNLEWCTPKFNVNHAWANNLASAKSGDEHPNTLYPDNTIHQICQCFVENILTMKEISILTGVPYTIVKQIKNHIIHTNISKNYNFSHYNVRKKINYTKDQLELAYVLL